MTATLTLLRVQLRILFWPLAVLLIGILPIPLLSKELADVVSTAAGVLSILAVILAGPLLFGAEYAEGAEGYLATRPASPRLVFALKSILIVAVSILGAVSEQLNVSFYLGVNGYFGAMTPLIWAVLLDAALCSATLTILLRDMVRGILLGALATPLILLGLIVCWKWGFMAHYALTPGGSSWSLDLEMSYYLNLPWHLAALFFTPILFLWFAAVADHWVRYSRLRAPLVASFLLLVPLAFLVCASLYLYTDGRTATYEPFSSFDGGQVHLAETTDGNEIRYVVFENRDASPLGPYKIYRLNAADFHQPPSLVASFGIETVSDSANDRTYQLCCNCYMDADRIVLHRAACGGIYVYDYDAKGPVRLLTATRTALSGFFTHKLLPGRLINVRFRESVEKAESAKYRNLRIDLANGRITEATQTDLASSSLPEDVYAGGRIYHSRKGTSPRDQNLQIYESIEAVARSSPREMNLLGPVIDGNQIAGFKRGDSGVIYVQDLSNWGNPQVALLTIPQRFWKDHLGLRKMFTRLGCQRLPSGGTSSWSWHHSPLTLGGGYLGYWEQHNWRVAIWDVHDLAHVQFLGVCDTPPGMPIPDFGSTPFSNANNPTTPFIRSDGALGYLNEFVGPFWLEFPALMKGAKS